MNDTYYDVWSVVASFLPNREVEKFCGVNRQLRLVGLDARFGNVRIYKHDSATKRLCEMLCQPEVGTRVQRLTIEPWLVQPKTKTRASRSENLWNRINTFFNPNYMEEEARKRVQKRVKKYIKRVTNAVKCLENVNEYRILYDERSPTYHPQLFEAFLSPTLEAIGRRLMRLTIKVPFELLPHLSYVRLPQLQELDIFLCTGNAPMEEVKYSLDGFFVFIHNLQNLEHFGISATSCSRNLDLSYFSKRWGTFPHLNSFSLCIPFNGSLLSAPEDLYKHVMEPHAKTLEKLKLGTTWCGPGRGPLPPDRHFWIQRILKSSFKVPFPRLLDVELALRPLRAELTDLHTFLRLHGLRLEKLSLTDRALSICELAELFKFFEGHPGGQNYLLKELKIKVDYLSAPLFALIAQHFPELKILALTFADIMCDPKDMQRARHQPLVKLESLENTLRPYSESVFSTWGLRTLHLISPTLPPKHELEQRLRECFPATLVFDDLSFSTD